MVLRGSASASIPQAASAEQAAAAAAAEQEAAAPAEQEAAAPAEEEVTPPPFLKNDSRTLFLKKDSFLGEIRLRVSYRPSSVFNNCSTINRASFMTHVTLHGCTDVYRNSTGAVQEQEYICEASIVRLLQYSNASIVRLFYCSLT